MACLGSVETQSLFFYPKEFLMETGGQRMPVRIAEVASQDQTLHQSQSCNEKSVLLSTPLAASIGAK